MRFREVSPMLYTRDLPGSVEFYTTRLGFRCESFSEEWGWASVRRDGVQIMFALPNQHLPFERPMLTGSLYIRTDDVEAAWRELEGAVRICYPIENFDYGMREFAIYDNNGYLIQFGQEIPVGPAQ